jgi:ubiquinone/menaquinone biosynthesis C-methylase UbiE
MSDGQTVIARFKRQVEEEWQNPVVAAAYRKWSREEAEWGRGARELMLERAQLAPGMRVLDLGSAHGEPGLAIAAAVGPEGHVTLTDIAPALLELAADRARATGLINVTTRRRGVPSTQERPHRLGGGGRFRPAHRERSAR